MKIILKLFGIITIVFLLFGCSHKHDFFLSKDEIYHYDKCECGKIKNKVEHSFSWIIDKEATDTEIGIKHLSCSVCGYKKEENTWIIPENVNIEEVTDDVIQKQLLDIKLDYGFVYPDTELSYKYMWDGYDLENKYGPNIEEKERLYTYLTEYWENDNKYYLIYIKKDLIDEYKIWMQEYQNKGKEDYYNYHFSNYNEEKIIDGKYLLAHQKATDKNMEGVKIFSCNSISKIVFSLKDYQLVLCAESKQAVIKENISTSEKINKKISLYKRVELCFESEKTQPNLYTFELYESVNQRMVQEMFNYVGEMIEVYPDNYETLDYSSYPILGMKDFWFKETVRAQVVIRGEEKTILLPRYVNNKEKLDLLSYESNLFFEDDVFRNYKEKFDDALIEETEQVYGEYIWALYKYEDVINIIKKGD